ATRNTPEVTNARKRDRDQAFEEFPHAVTMQGDLHADGHFLPHLEARDRVSCTRYHCLLTRNGRKVGGGFFDEPLVSRSCAHTHVEHDLLETRHLHRILVTQVVDQGGNHFLAVFFLELEHVSFRGERRRALLD